jgi:hypothetical protein
VTAFVPVGVSAPAEAAILPYLTGPGSVFTVPLVPLAGADDAEATHLGTCAAVSDASRLYAALPGLKAAIPGAEYDTVPRLPYPWVFPHATHWDAWLAGHGLKPQRLSNQ